MYLPVSFIFSVTVFLLCVQGTLSKSEWEAASKLLHYTQSCTNTMKKVKIKNVFCGGCEGVVCATQVVCSSITSTLYHDHSKDGDIFIIVIGLF